VRPLGAEHVQTSEAGEISCVLFTLRLCGKRNNRRGRHPQVSHALLELVVRIPTRVLRSNCSGVEPHNHTGRQRLRVVVSRTGQSRDLCVDHNELHRLFTRNRFHRYHLLNLSTELG
jgi:hypothetical protein